MEPKATQYQFEIKNGIFSTVDVFHGEYHVIVTDLLLHPPDTSEQLFFVVLM